MVLVNAANPKGQRIDCSSIPVKFKDGAEHFVSVIRGEIEVDPLCGLELNILVQEVSTAGYQSIREKREIALSWTKWISASAPVFFVGREHAFAPPAGELPLMSPTATLESVRRAGAIGQEPSLTVCSLAPQPEPPDAPVPASLCGRWAPQSASGSSLVRPEKRQPCTSGGLSCLSSPK